MSLELFSVEALDTRLQASTDEKKRQKIIARAGKPRWNTVEFYFYAACFVVFVPLMFKAAYDVSTPANPHYSRFEHMLTPGWLGRPVDNTDEQYRGFREPFPMLVLLIGLHQGARRLCPRSIPRPTFDAAFGVALLTLLHGISVVKILTLLAINFAISRNETYARPLTWIFGVGMLFSNELLLGYPFASLSPYLAFLDSFGGLMPRWEVFFKCSMLRMVSFNIDYLDALATDTSVDEKATNTTVNAERERTDTPRPLGEYSFVNFVGYVLYAPLYIAGPILNFNDYMAQSQQPLPSINRKNIIRYAVRFLISMFVMELLLHFTYVVAIQHTKAWEGSTPFQVSMVAFFNLVIIWLKLMLPWRFFRLWALIDGIDAPENMVRCVANNYSAMSFWRSWHRSFNRWVVRYLYIPLGGSSRPIVNSLVVFTFVALWHDIQLRLFIWGWLVVLFVLPEMLASLVFPAKNWQSSPLYRHICAVGAVANIWMMMIANLVGFAVGVDGIKAMLHDIVSTASGLQFVILCSSLLFVGSQVMFEVREREHRAGIDLRC